MKKILLFLIFCFITLQSDAQIITGEVKYTEENARQKVFSIQIQEPSFEFIRIHLIDPNFAENSTALFEGKTELKDRKLAKFSDGTYGVTFYDDPLYSWIYSFNGRLVNFTQKEKLSYPAKIVKYRPDGSVANSGYKISEKESFIFDTNGKLIAHWDGNLCFDSYNNVIMTRKYYE